jgi:hypothetical protein
MWVWTSSLLKYCETCLLGCFWVVFGGRSRRWQGRGRRWRSATALRRGLRTPPSDWNCSLAPRPIDHLRRGGIALLRRSAPNRCRAPRGHHSGRWSELAVTDASAPTRPISRPRKRRPGRTGDIQAHNLVWRISRASARSIALPSDPEDIELLLGGEGA